MVPVEQEPWIVVSGYMSGEDGWGLLGVAVLTVLVAFESYINATSRLSIGLAVGPVARSSATTAPRLLPRGSQTSAFAHRRSVRT